MIDCVHDNHSKGTRPTLSPHFRFGPSLTRSVVGETSHRPQRKLCLRANFRRRGKVAAIFTRFRLLCALWAVSFGALIVRAGSRSCARARTRQNEREWANKCLFRRRQSSDRKQVNQSFAEPLPFGRKGQKGRKERERE